MSNFLKRGDPRPSKTAVVEIPEWGGAVKVRPMPLDLVFLAREENGEKEREVVIQLILSCVLAEDGTPFFSSADEVRQIDMAIFMRLQEAIVGLSSPDAKAIEKN